MPSKLLTGLSAAAAGVRGVQRGVQTRETAQANKAVQDQKLKESQARIERMPSVDQAQRATEAKLQTLEAENQKMRGEVSGQKLKRAIGVFDINGDTSGIMDTLKNDDHFKSFYGPLAGLESMNVGSDQDLRMLEDARFTHIKNTDPKLYKELYEREEGGPIEENLAEAASFWQENPELLKRHVKTIGTDGTTDVMDMNMFKARNDYYSDNPDKVKSDRAQVKLELDRARLAELVREAARAEEGKTPTIQSREQIKNEMVKNLNISIEEAEERLVAKEEEGVRSGQLRAAAKAEDTIIEHFGGKDAFLAKENFTSADKLDVKDSIATIEKHLGSLDQATVKDLKSAGKLTTLALTASGLSEESTGLLDNIENKLGDLIKSDIPKAKQKAARAALLQFQNIFRHELFGSALSKYEINLNNASAGTLIEQLPSIIVKLKEQVNQVKSSVTTVSGLENQVLAKLYMSGSLTNINKVISNLDETLIGLGADPKELGIEETPTTEPTKSGNESDFDDMLGGL